MYSKNLYLEFYWEFKVDPMGNVVHNVQLYHHAEFEYFWASGWPSFCISKFRGNLNIGQSILQ
jgi:hypothetical protein